MDYTLKVSQHSPRIAPNGRNHLGLCARSAAALGFALAGGWVPPVRSMLQMWTTLQHGGPNHLGFVGTKGQAAAETADDRPGASRGAHYISYPFLVHSLCIPCTLLWPRRAFKYSVHYSAPASLHVCIPHAFLMHPLCIPYALLCICICVTRRGGRSSSPAKPRPPRTPTSRPTLR